MRRRRLVAVFVLVAVIALVVARTSTSSHKSAGAKPRATNAQKASTAPPTTTQLQSVAATWQLGAPLSRSVAFTAGADVLVAGGLAADQSTTSSVVRLDPATGSATNAGTLAQATHDAAGGVLANQQFVFGGGNQTVTDAVQVLHAGGPGAIVGRLPQPRADLAAVTIGATVYLVGGYDGNNATRDVLATTNGTQFRTVAQLPVGVRYPAVTAVGNVIYAFGGEWGGTESGAVQSIDVATGTARLVGQLPSPRTDAAAVTLGGSVYVVGGRAGGSASSDILRFDASRGQFSLEGQLPAPVANSAVAQVGGTVYLIGGEAAAISAGVAVLRQVVTAASAPLSPALVRPFAGRLLIADRGNDRLIVIDANKQMSWSYPSASRPAPPGGFYFPDDGFFADHAQSIVTNQEENHTIVKIAFPSGALQWSYGTPKVAGSAPGFLNQPDDAFLLRDGSFSVADAKNCRVLFIGADGKPISQIGTTGNCVHDPPRSLGYPNGDTPLPDGNFLISEINGSWISEYTRSGVLVWTLHLPVTYPSDPQQLGPDLYLVADYTKPGGILEFTREGQIVWSYRPTSGPGMLDHPSLAERLPNGLIAVNDDYRHRVAFIDPATRAIVWQYGQTDQPGTGPDQLNTPDGFDLLLPDGSTPTHPSTG